MNFLISEYFSTIFFYELLKVRIGYLLYRNRAKREKKIDEMKFCFMSKMTKNHENWLISTSEASSIFEVEFIFRAERKRSKCFFVETVKNVIFFRRNEIQFYVKNQRKSTTIHLFYERSEFNNWIWVDFWHGYFSSGAKKV